VIGRIGNTVRVLYELMCDIHLETKDKSLFSFFVGNELECHGLNRQGLLSIQEPTILDLKDTTANLDRYMTMFERLVNIANVPTTAVFDPCCKKLMETYEESYSKGDDCS
jgi:hypothetical protein